MRPLSDLPKIDGLKFVGIANDGARLACQVFVARGGVIECRAPFIAGRDDIREDLKGWEAVKPTKKAEGEMCSNKFHPECDEACTEEARHEGGCFEFMPGENERPQLPNNHQ